VIPKKHYSSDVLSLPDDCLIGLVFASKEVSKILSKLLEVGRVAVLLTRCQHILPVVNNTCISSWLKVLGFCSQDSYS
jgi:hypothetical protein